ncbi:hypothetical protein FocTR4_00004350 [Fusarium oxysporum f. sp. cubense]|uniref:Uncharacterized protein n=1 Tax=Fusarium oxysporum f. sp. cubense TaxID=61366 RepID=A0A5C6TAM3_FUSOC|nr:hypothetical protein FocTR4_00004350 [Fusarium oxysporum f. sp. cubense]
MVHSSLAAGEEHGPELNKTISRACSTPTYITSLGCTATLLQCFATQPVPPLQEAYHESKPDASDTDCESPLDARHISAEDPIKLIGREGCADLRGASGEKLEWVHTGGVGGQHIEHDIDECGLAGRNKEGPPNGLED